MAGLTKEQRAAKAAEDAAKAADEQTVAIEARALELSGLEADAYAALSEEDRAKFIEQAKADKPAVPHEPIKSATKAKADDSHLIAVTKGGETIKVHPSCMADHKRLGWVEA